MKQSKVALGTVQFGLDYGINNTRGRVPESEVEDILRFAAANGIDTLDTARAYGSSEEVLGRVLEETGLEFKIVSKAPPGWNGRNDGPEESLSLLRKESLYAYLYHDYKTYRENPATFDAMTGLKNNGRTAKIGFSFYYPQDAETVLSAGLPVDLVQVPYNLFDRRFEKVMKMCGSRGIEVHVRSVFLQGLFHRDPNRLGGNLAKARTGLEKLRSIAADNSMSVSELCIGFVSANSFVDKIVIGVDSLEDLEENVSAEAKSGLAAETISGLEGLATSDEDIILPFKWRTE
jgi:aryl-alcohol dehydrogenase-like predicted oxidoreductase